MAAGVIRVPDIAVIVCDGAVGGEVSSLGVIHEGLPRPGGFIPEDGFTERVSQESSTALRDINKDLLDEVSGSFTETLTVGLMEVKKDALATYYGAANVTDASGKLTVDHNWGKSEETFQYAMLLLLKNNRKWVKHIPQGKVTDRGDFTGNKTTAAQREVTITYTVDSAGSGCKDYYDSTETSA